MAAEGDAPPPAQKKKKGKAKKEEGIVDGVTGIDEKSLEALKAKIQVLEAENAKLKKQKRAAGAAGEDAEPEQPKEKKQKKEKTSSQKAASDAIEEEPAPLVDVSAWEDFHLSPKILGAVARVGFSAPTHVQAECLPAAIRDGRDVIGAAQTGSGKTLAFGLPILQLLLQRREAAQAAGQPRPPILRALVVAPTRELAMQVCEHLQAVGKHVGVWVVPLVGGISQLKQQRLLSKHPEVVVATPGRLWDLMKDGQPHVANLRGLEFLVIDEADRMVQQGHYAELTSILQAVSAAAGLLEAGLDAPERVADDKAATTSEEGEQVEDDAESNKEKQGKKGSGAPPLQTFVFSATLTLPTDMRRRLKKGGGGSSGSATLESLMDMVPFAGRGQPKIVDLTSDRKVADKITEACISCPEQERDEYLYCLLVSHPGRTIVFVNAVSSVRRLAAILKLLGLPVHPLHAGMQQRARLKALDRFRADPNGVLVATDVAARGLDIKDVKCVVHYQLPAAVDVYVHRSGRTARADAEGIAIALVTPNEDARYRALLRALGRASPPEFPLDESLMGAVKERARLAIRLDALERHDSKERAEKSWRKLHAEQLDLVLSDESEADDEEGGRKKRRAGKKGGKAAAAGPSGKELKKAEAEQLRAQLGELLAEPLQPRYSKKFFTGGAAAGVAVQQEQQRKKAAAAGKQAEATGNGGGQAATVKSAVAMAQRLADSHAAAGEGKGKGKAAASGAIKKKPAARMSRAAALAAAVQKAMQKKGQGKWPKLVVVPQALGRESQGPDALQALRQRLAAE